MTSTVYTKSYTAPPFDIKEIMRYAGAKGDSCEVEELVLSCIEEARDRFVYKVCFKEIPISLADDRLDLGFAVTDSADLRKNLKNCGSIVLFAATVGMEIDRLVARYSTVSPARALIFQAIGGERIESLCDLFNSDVKDKQAAAGRGTRPRYSPGYGDLPLSFQKDIFRVLDCPRKIGVTLNDSLLMSPSKSVTALIGIENKPEL